MEIAAARWRKTAALPSVGCRADARRQLAERRDLRIGRCVRAVQVGVEVAKGVDTGYVYGAVQWGFALANAAKGTITGERSSGQDFASPTADAAVRRFNEYYRKPGASTAPTR
jgi:hypothetical protein